MTDGTLRQRLRTACQRFVVMLLAVVMLIAGSGGSQTSSLPGGKLVDSLGRPVDLHALLSRTTPAIVSFTYLGCRTICPASDIVMDQVDSLMGPGANDVQLLTLTIDPANDTPELLQRRAREMGSTERRIWLTGALPEVYRTLDDLGMQFGRIDDHEALFVIFRSGGRVVQRVNGMPDPAALLKAARGR